MDAEASPGGRLQLAPGPSGLVERDSEVARLAAHVAAAMAGSGSAVLVEGEAGIGKSSLLGVVALMARRAGCTVLEARAAELESGFGYGVARQLLERHLRLLPSSERAEVLAGAAAAGGAVLGLGESEAQSVAFRDPLGVQHALYWVVANLADLRPLVMVVDDVQWADVASLRWFLFLVRRLADIPVALIVAMRPPPGGPSGEDPRELELLRTDPNVDVIDVAPLGLGGVRELAARTFTGGFSDAFAERCLELTGGNPWLVLELFDALEAQGIDPSEVALARLESLGPRRVAHHVLLRASCAGRAGVRVAQAVAVLGQGAELRHVAELAELDLGSASEVVVSLTGASILAPGSPLGFVHPIVHAAVYEDIHAARRAYLHREAARIFAAEGRGDQAALHLLRAERGGDRRAVECLIEAAAAELGRGAPQEAATFLERALDEPPPDDLRSAVLLALGGALAACGRVEEAVGCLDEAERTCEGERRLEAAATLASVLTLAGRTLEAAVRLSSALKRPGGDARLRVRCRVQLAALIRGYRPLAEEGRRVVDELRSDLAGRVIEDGTLEGRLALGVLALDDALLNRPASAAAELALRALRQEEGAIDEFLWAPAVVTLIFCDRIADAERYLDAWVEGARRRGSILAWSVAAPLRAYAAQRAGDLNRAEAEAEAVLLVAREHRLAFANFLAPLLLSGIALERDRTDEAEAYLELVEKEGLGESGWFGQVRFFRALVQLQRGAWEPALSELLDMGKDQQEELMWSPAVLPWRSVAAVAARGLGERELALRLADEEVELARAFGAPRTLGIALRAAGMVRGEKGQSLLEGSVEALEGSSDRLELARSLAELASLLAKRKKTREARALLLRALDLAHACGAPALAERTATELVATGARRARRVMGAEALTASERRVAELARRGLSNAEIAQTLFLSRRTVESHLQSAYRKLAISRREELAGRLGRPPSNFQ